MLTARELMRGDAITLTPDMLVEDAVKTLLRKRISGAPVVTDGQVVGMFSERDALTALAAASYESEPSGTVGMHMRREPISISPATDMFAIAAEFNRNPVRRLIVVDSDGRMLGVVMRGDLLRALVERTAPSEAHPPRTALERATERLRDP
jgi:predicted transcriptional regulator